MYNKWRCSSVGRAQEPKPCLAIASSVMRGNQKEWFRPEVGGSSPSAATVNVKIYKTTRNHRQLQRLIEEPEAICVDTSKEGRTLLTTIPYKKHVLVEEGVCLPPYLARAKRKVK